MSNLFSTLRVLVSRPFTLHLHRVSTHSFLILCTLILIGCQADPEQFGKRSEQSLVPELRVSAPKTKFVRIKSFEDRQSKARKHPYPHSSGNANAYTEAENVSGMAAIEKAITEGTPKKTETPKKADDFDTRVEGRKPKIGILLPLSEKGSHTGKPLLDAIQLAFFESSIAELELIIFDTKGDPSTAAKAAERAVAAGVDLILGPLFGGSTAALAPITQAAGIKVISFSNDRFVAGNGIYVFGFLPSQQIERMIKFSLNNGYAKIGALVPDSPFGKFAIKKAEEVIDPTEGLLVRARYYEPSVQDLTGVVREFSEYQNRRNNLKIQKAQLQRQKDEIAMKSLIKLSRLETLGNPSFDAVFLPSGGSELSRIAPLLAFYDVDPSRVRLLGTTLWDETRNLSLEPALLGAWYAAPSPDRVRPFYEKFENYFGYKPPRLATLGYDAMLLGAEITLEKKEESDGFGSLSDPRGFSGVDGIVRLLPDGTNERGLAVLEIQKDGARVIDGAPTTFLSIKD